MGKTKKKTSDVTSEIHAALVGWKPDDEAIDRVYDVTRKTLDEATHLTEYEDGKASRVLTAIAFLSGLAGGLYGVAASKQLVRLNPWFIYLFHGLFLLFVVLVVAGAFLVVWAIRPRFNIPLSWEEKQEQKEKENQKAQASGDEGTSAGTQVAVNQPAASADPRSFLFALQIVKSTPAEWVHAFRRHGGDKAGDLKREYIKDHIHESYLIADKVITKLRPLQRGMNLFLVAMVVLGLWLVVTVCAVCAQQVWQPTDGTPRVTEGTGRHAVVFTDADNTLWDTNGLYATAQLGMLDHVEAATGRRATGDRLAFVRVVDQRIAKAHPLGLRYPPQLLVAGLVEALSAQSGGTSQPRTGPTTVTANRPTLDMDKEAAEYLEGIGGLPALRPGVRSGLERLQSQGLKVIIVTEGSETTALKRLNHHGLLSVVDHVVEGVKSPDLYHRLADEYAKGQPAVFMIGDQLDRDIVFASKAGFLTFYYPGGFTPAWMPDVANAKPDYQIVSYDEVVDPIIRKLKK